MIPDPYDYPALEAQGWHQESSGLWNNVKHHIHGRQKPFLICNPPGTPGEPIHPRQETP